MDKIELTHNYLKSLLHYYPETGVFIRLITTSSRATIGSVAGFMDGRYMRVRINDKQYLLHRLAWFYVYGTWPENIDHIDHDRFNNKINNLRDVNMQVNKQNLIKARKDNKIGLLGVHKVRNKYRASIKLETGHKHLGMFDTPEQAHTAYLEAKRKYHKGCTI